MSPSRRMLRINQLLREEIAELLRRETKDEALSSSFISITEVDTSPDLRTAKVYFSVFGDEEEILETKKRLDKAAGFLRRSMMGGRLDLRQIPHLEFVVDHSLAQGDRIMQLMRGIDTEQPAGSQREDDEPA